MKKTFILLCFIAFGISTMAQIPTIKNSSFENWHSIGGYLYPTNFSFVDSAAVKAGVLTRKSGGTDGSYSLHLGCYSDGTKLMGAGIMIIDTLTDKIRGLSFDYKVQNNLTSSLNGLLIHIYFFDDKQSYLSDYSWKSSNLGNYVNFVTGNFTSMFCSNAARYYSLDIGYFNYSGSVNEYAEIDNLHFLKSTSIVEDNSNSKSNIKPYPNPASNNFSLNGININYIGALYLIDINGSQYKLKVASLIDISSIPNGIYMLKVFNNSNELIQSTKLVVEK